MVVAEQVQGRMDGKKRKFPFGRMTVFRRLFHGLFGGDDDVAEQNGIEFYNGNIVTWFSLLCYR